MKARRPLVKLLVPSAGLAGLYAGAFLGLWLVSLTRLWGSALAQLAGAAPLAAAAAFGGLFAADARLGPQASHVDVLKTLFYMLVAAAAVTVERLVGERLGMALPQFLENLAIWGAGVASVWEEEPGFPGWPTLLERLRARVRGR